MRYLYGDSTPFPLEDDFLDLMRDITKLAVAILSAQHQMRSVAAKVKQAIVDSEAERKWLADLGQAVAALIQGRVSGTTSTEVARHVDRLLESTKRVVEEARGQIINQRDAELRELEAAASDKRRRIQPELERFFLRHQLPETVWGLSWRARLQEPPTVSAEALALYACDLEATFALELSEQSIWSRPVRVGELVPHLTLRLPTRGSLGGRMRSRAVQIHRYLITAVDLAPQKHVLVVRKKAAEDCPSYRISYTAGQDAPIAESLDGDSEGAIVLDPAESEAVFDLMEKVEQGLRPTLGQRVNMSEVLFKEQRLHEVDDLGELARALINTVAPLVREVVARSPNPDELCLKRELAERRREELFVPRAELIGPILSLAPEDRAVFAPFGLLQPEPTPLVKPRLAGKPAANAGKPPAKAGCTRQATDEPTKPKGRAPESKEEASGKTSKNRLPAVAEGGR